MNIIFKRNCVILFIQLPWDAKVEVVSHLKNCLKQNKKNPQRKIPDSKFKQYQKLFVTLSSSGKVYFHSFSFSCAIKFVLTLNIHIDLLCDGPLIPEFLLEAQVTIKYATLS